MNAFRHVQCRLYDLQSGTNLALDGCSAQVHITDVHASVTLSQRFTNQIPGSSSIVGVYSFGLMANAAVYGFEMVREDGNRIKGIVKEKQEAKKEFDQAIQQGHTASLGQQETKDVFSITVGNISASETVTVNIRYLQPLIDDEKKDQIKFIFPRTYAQRYGAAPTPNSAIGSTAHQPFQMSVIVQQASAIKGISCPSHPITLELGSPDGVTVPEETATSSHFASVSLTDRTGSLTQDIVLVISAVGLDSPRCFIEPHPSPEYETTALALTFVPRFRLPDVSGGMEYIFVVDRSGSMQGQNIELVRDALVVLLRGLPTVETTFNIFSFGNEATKLWDASRAYSQATLEEATNHVDSMQANYGGTKIAKALKFVYDSLQNPLVRPVAVFLLTDGSAWDVSTCVEYTSSSRSALPDPKNPATSLRVFTVGIGDGASSDTCESIARAGGGMAVYVKQGEALTGKCARLVRAARTPDVKVEVVWDITEQTKDSKSLSAEDDDFEIVEDPSPLATSEITPGKVINPFDDNAGDVDLPTGPPPKPNPTLPPPAPIQQSPVEMPTLFPGTRTQIYAIIHTHSKSHMLSTTKTIKVQGRVTSTGDLVELEVPVSTALSSPFTESQFDSGIIRDSNFAFLHILAAKSLIRDREEGKHAFPTTVSASFELTSGDNDNKAELKTAYLEKDIIRLGTLYGLSSRYTSFIAVDYRDHAIVPLPPPPAPARFHGQMATVRNARGPITSSSIHRSRSSRHAPSSATVDAAGMLFSDLGLQRRRSVQSQHTITTGDLLAFSGQPPWRPTMTADGLLASVARLQQWDGGFQLNAQLLDLLGKALNLPSPLDVDGFASQLEQNGIETTLHLHHLDLGATLLAVIWMEENGGDESLDMREKAEEWLKREVGGEEKVGLLKKAVLRILGLTEERSHD